MTKYKRCGKHDVELIVIDREFTPAEIQEIKCYMDNSNAKIETAPPMTDKHKHCEGSPLQTINRISHIIQCAEELLKSTDGRKPDEVIPVSVRVCRGLCYEILQMQLPSKKEEEVKNVC